MALYRLGDDVPQIAPNTFVAPEATLIGKGCLVGAGAIVTERKVFPDRSLILGAPAKVVRELSDEDAARLMDSASQYASRQEFHRARLERIG